MEALTPEGRAAVDKVAVGRTFADDGQRLQWMVESLQRRMSYEQETRLHRALGVTSAKPSPEDLIAAAEGQKRALESARSNSRQNETSNAETRRLQAEVAALRDDLRGQERRATRERELDRRDEQEELAEKRRIAEALKIPIERVL